MTDKRAITSALNGLLGGRKKGTKNKSTLEREEAAKAYGDAIRQVLIPLFHSQVAVAKGVAYVYRIDKHREKSGPVRIEHVLLEEPREIADALDILANGDPNGDEEGNGFYYIHVKEPQNNAIESLLNRGLGKVAQPIAGDKDNPLELVTVVKYAKGTNPSA